MKNFNRLFLHLGLLLTVSFGMISCKKDPSVLKVFVRSASNELVTNAEVVVIGNKSANPPALDFVDTLFTNGSGYVEFNMDAYFDEVKEKNAAAEFNLIVKKDLKFGNGNVRCRVHNTAVETVFLSN